MKDSIYQVILLIVSTLSIGEIVATTNVIFPKEDNTKHDMKPQSTTTDLIGTVK
jgi:hypothetical protein